MSDLPQKSTTAFRTIGEVADELDIAQHVLRFWETKFPQIRPVKRRGRRYYRPEDLAFLQSIKTLLYSEGYTIKGVQRYLESVADRPMVETPAPSLKRTMEVGLASNKALQDVIAELSGLQKKLEQVLETVN